MINLTSEQALERWPIMVGDFHECMQHNYYACTLPMHHPGEHVAHGWIEGPDIDGEVLKVWSRDGLVLYDSEGFDV